MNKKEKKMPKALRRVAFILLTGILLLPLNSWSQVENLDEMGRRKSRQTSATWGYRYLEDRERGYVWQPETLCYADVTTGHEVWRMCNTPALANFYHDDIGVSPWSADGKRLAFVTPRDTGAFNRDGYRLWMLVDADGSNLRPIVNGPSRVFSHNPYFHWSPQVPDTYYQFGRTRAGNTGVSTNTLYKAAVSDEGVTRKALLTFPTSHSSELFLNKTISGDGRKVIAMPWDESWWYPATVFPDSEARIADSDGYTVDRNMPSSWGDTPSSYSSLHDQYYAGDGTWIFVMPSGSHAWWRLKVLGTAADGGSRYTEPFNEQWPENTDPAWGGTGDPFGCDYWSHFVPDRWGRHALFSNGEASPLGPGVWDIRDHRYVVTTFGGGAQHHDWHGFTDWFVSTRGNTMITTSKYYDANSSVLVCNPHARTNGSTAYYTLPRPGQSPDGTKVAFHSDFLNGAVNGGDVYWAVCYYPHPPRITGATKVANGIQIQWTSPKYTQRGWPNDETSPVPEPKEIKSYHIWASDDKSSWREVTSLGVPFGTNSYNFTQPNGSTRYYAMTSEEWSGLESRTLSNIWSVRLDSNGNISWNVEDTLYPPNPGGVHPFWTQKPPSPYNVNAVKQATPGHYLITWTEPNNSKVRYYNIYYSTSGTPPVDQRYRIASVPAGTSTYLDWCADPSRQGYYRVTSVDRQGNESDNQSSADPPAPPTGLRVVGTQ